MMTVKRYNTEHKEDWDRFIEKAKNGTFLFMRNYMEYHADRFEDFSLLVFKKNKLVALFPANKVDNSVFSHQGLTFGGLILKTNVHSQDAIAYFNAINQYLKEQGISKVRIKTIPQIYKKQLCDLEEYFMFRSNAKLIYRNASSVIELNKDISISRNRKRNYQKSVEHNLELIPNDNFDVFWHIMEDNLETRFKVKPTHSCEEMKRLYSLFPNNIRLLLIKQGKDILGGCLLYLFDNVLKVQYAHASSKGKELGAIDHLYFKLIEEYKGQLDYLDFGTSNTDNGHTINSGLLSQKEGFGAHVVAFNGYEYSTTVFID